MSSGGQEFAAGHPPQGLPESGAPPGRTVRWGSVARAAFVDVLVGFAGAALVVLVVFTNRSVQPSGEVEFSASGAPALLFALGLLMVVGSVFLFVPVIVIAAVVSRGPRLMPGDAPPSATVPEPESYGLPVSQLFSDWVSPLAPPAPSASPLSSVDARRVAAESGGNARGLFSPRRWPAWTAATVTLVLFVGLFVFAGSDGVESSSGGQVTGLGSWVAVALFVVTSAGMVFALWWMYRTPGTDKVDYARSFARLPEQVREDALSGVVERQFTEDVQEVRKVGGDLNEATVRQAQELALKLSGLFFSGRLPKSPWAHAFWARFAEPALGREAAMREVAERFGVRFVPYVESYGSAPTPAPAVLSGAGLFARFFQQRNELVFEDAEYPVRVVDVVLLTPVKRKGMSVGVKGLRPSVRRISTVRTLSYAETWFPADHWLSVRPRSRGSFGRRASALGDDALARRFAGRFAVRSDDDAWARLVLSPAVMRLLLEVPAVGLSVDAGRLTVFTVSGWLPPERVGSAVELVRRLARSARPAERG